MPEKKTLNEDLFYKGSSANLPRLHTCENKVPFWDFKEIAVTLYWNNIKTQKTFPLFTERLSDKILIVSNTFKWNEECGLLRTKKKFTLIFSEHSRLFIRCSTMEHIYIYIYIYKSWTSPGGDTPQDTNCTATCLLSRKLFKLDEPDMQDTAGEAGTNS